MKTYILQARIDNQLTTVGINARDNFSAKVLATQRINSNFVSDKRYAIGEITLKDPSGKVIWNIPQEAKEEKKGGE